MSQPFVPMKIKEKETRTLAQSQLNAIAASSTTLAKFSRFTTYRSRSDS